jgi:MerR family transcriptional regulator, copper efflux regulator
LEEIKRKIGIKKIKEVESSEVEKHIGEVTKQIHQLHTELAAILPLIEQLDDQDKLAFSKRLTTESTSLIKSLLSLTS